jgi:hypothetical protein
MGLYPFFYVGGGSDPGSEDNDNSRILAGLLMSDMIDFRMSFVISAKNAYFWIGVVVFSE